MKNSKLFAIVVACIFSVGSLHADQNVYPAIGTNKLDVSTLVRVGEFWGHNWNREYKVATKISKNTMVVTLFPKKDEAWNYYCKITVKDFVLPDKKAIRTKQKKDEKWLYNCDIEFFYNVEYPSIEECFANFGGFVVNSKDPEAKKRTVEGLIALNEYFFTAGEKFSDKANEKMNIWLFFDEVGMRIFLRDHLKF